MPLDLHAASEMPPEALTPSYLDQMKRKMSLPALLVGPYRRFALTHVVLRLGERYK